MKVSQLLRKSVPQYAVVPNYLRPHPQTSVGIEVELEGIAVTTATRHPFKRWAVVEDGSLKGGCELVSDPVWGSAIDDALEELRDFLLIHHPYISDRCSIHVHINILDLSTEELASFLSLCVVYEKSLCNMYPERSGNTFCIPVYKSRVLQRAFGRLRRDLDRGAISSRGYVGWKYSGININSIYTKGTIEFRQSSGISTVGKLSTWINILLQLKVAAMLGSDIHSPRDVFQEQLENIPVDMGDVVSGLKMLDFIDMGEE